MGYSIRVMKVLFDKKYYFDVKIKNKFHFFRKIFLSVHACNYAKKKKDDRGSWLAFAP